MGGETEAKRSFLCSLYRIDGGTRTYCTNCNFQYSPVACAVPARILFTAFVEYAPAQTDYLCFRLSSLSILRWPLYTLPIVRIYASNVSTVSVLGIRPGVRCTVQTCRNMRWESSKYTQRRLKPPLLLPVFRCRKVDEIVQDVKAAYPGVRLGIHCHNDQGLAVANSLQAVRSGADVVQAS